MVVRIQAHNLDRRYGDFSAVSNVSLEVRSGETLAILGPSGSGKSTLLRLLHLLERPDSGTVELDGGVAPRTGPAWVHAIRRFGFVQQRPGLLRMSALENVAFPLRARGVKREDARNEARMWLKRLGLERRFHARPHELSGGELQRVALARALAPKPEFLLIDEGTNQLDPHAIRLVESLLLEEVRRGAALVVVTHNSGQARRIADRFLFLEGGRILEAGDRAQLVEPATPDFQNFLEVA